MNEWINFFLLYTVVVSINKIGFHISRPETNIDMMWKIALSNTWLYSACRAFFPACGVIHETFTSLSNPWLYWGAFRDDTKNGCVADYTINWYVQTFDRRLILTSWKIALSNPNVDVRILAQGYFVAINSLSLLWTFNKMKYAKPCLL